MKCEDCEKWFNFEEMDDGYEAGRVIWTCPRCSAWRYEERWKDGEKTEDVKARKSEEFSAWDSNA